MIILQQTRGNLSSGDQLALDLPFAETKSLAARIGPTPIFSRASGATYVGSDGLIHGIDTSTTSNSISAGSKSFTLTATAGQDQLWRTGDAVEAANGTNSMFGTVTSYDATTQVLVCNMTSISGTGTFTSWRIGYRGPRFDHNPVSPFASRGLLIEDGRTNLLVQSENFGTTWATAGITVDPNQTASPDGLVTADQITSTTSNGAIYQTFSATAGVTYTFSVWVKTVSSNVSTLLRINNNSGTNYASETIITSSSWQRVTITHTSANTEILRATIGGGSTLGIGATLYVWGAQVEAGSFATSYIPTTTSTLTRAADTCNITGDAFNSFYNQSEGTLFADVSGLMNTTLSGARPFVALSDGTYQNQILILKNPNVGFLGAAGTVSNSSQFNFSNTYSPSTPYKVALGFKTNDANAAFNGALGTTDTSVTMPSTMNRLELRDATGATGGQPTGHIAAIRYYKKRLPNAKLQALTA